MRILFGLLLAAALGVAAYGLLAPVPFDPVAVDRGPNPGFSGPFAKNGGLDGAELLKLGSGKGPEDVAMGPDGLLYTGLEDGRIVRLPADGSAPAAVFADTQGRPLGLQFDSGGNLIVADAVKGLLTVDPRGEVRLLTDAAEGKRMLFVDDLDIAPDGTIWFSDASRRFGIRDSANEFWEGRATGRLLSYTPATGQTRVHLKDLHFANGVALGPNAEFVLVNETMAYRITRLWLKGPKAGTSEIFLSALPGFPDNIAFDGQGTFWVALVFPRDPNLDALMPMPMLRRAVYAWTSALGEPPLPPVYAWTIGVNGDGQVVHNLQSGAGRMGLVTSVNRFGGHLYLGSLTFESIAKIPAP